MEILAVKDLTFTYPEAHAPVLRQISFAVEEGEFAVVCGATGCGKSTLLRLIKRELAPVGARTGDVLYRGASIEALSPRAAAERIGFVAQDPEHQIVCDKVSHELAFGLESLGWDQPSIARRVAEMASYFGIGDWFDRRVSELSGGQKQLLNLAAVMAMNPDLLILDEPTSQLDPIAASEFVDTLKKLNRDFSVTVLIAEHRLEELIPICDRLILLEDGQLLGAGAPRDTVVLTENRPALLSAMPTAVRLFHQSGGSGSAPLTVKEGRRWLLSRFSNAGAACEELPLVEGTPALELSGVCFRYARELPDAVRELELTVNEGEIYCILGGNGSGKSTALGVAAGLRRPYAGRVRVFGKRLKDYGEHSLYRGCVALLPQNVQTVFLRDTVEEELAEIKGDPLELPFDLTPLYRRHPYDLSGGEQQLVALAKVLLTRPRLLLMDEPTKGLDAQKKATLVSLLRDLRAKGITVVAVTHDVEFAASCADRCGLFFRGALISEGTPRAFFSENQFYTTAARRISRGFYENAVTAEDVLSLCAADGAEEGSVC